LLARIIRVKTRSRRNPSEAKVERLCLAAASEAICGEISCEGLSSCRAPNITMMDLALTPSLDVFLLWGSTAIDTLSFYFPRSMNNPS